MNRTHLTSLLAVAAAAPVALGIPGVATAAPAAPVGHVYEATNAAAGNAVAVFDRYADGTLQPAGTVA
ncbi:MAG: hypothetical protein WAV00_09285, partial [Nocardioides sp.]